MLMPISAIQRSFLTCSRTEITTLSHTSTIQDPYSKWATSDNNTREVVAPERSTLQIISGSNCFMHNTKKNSKIRRDHEVLKPPVWSQNLQEIVILHRDSAT